MGGRWPAPQRPGYLWIEGSTRARGGWRRARETEGEFLDLALLAVRGIRQARKRRADRLLRADVPQHDSRPASRMGRPPTAAHPECIGSLRSVEVVPGEPAGDLLAEPGPPGLGGPEVDPLVHTRVDRVGDDVREAPVRARDVGQPGDVRTTLKAIWSLPKKALAACMMRPARSCTRTDDPDTAGRESGVHAGRRRCAGCRRRRPDGSR